MADFAQQLAGATEAEPTEPLPTATLPAARRARSYRRAFRKSRWALVGAAVTAALALVAVVVAITGTGGSGSPSTPPRPAVDLIASTLAVP